MKKFKLIDNTFSYIGESEFGSQNGFIAINRTPENIQWVHEGFGNHMNTFNNLSSDDETFYTENLIQLGLQDKVSSKKYAILLEPRWYNPMTAEIKRNPDPYVQAYDLIFTHDRDLVNYNPDVFKFIIAQGSIVEEFGLFEKSKLVSCIVSEKTMSDGHKLRLEIARQIQQSGQVDMYGKAFNYIKHKIDSLKDYMFSFAMENDYYNSYFTEKLHDCFLTGTIPIYLGAPDIGDYFNLDGMIIMEKDSEGNITFDSEILTEEYYNNHIDAVKDNYYRALKHVTVEDYIYNNYFS